MAVSIAAVNGPASVVISGDAEAVEQVAERFADRGVRVRRLRVSHGFHSHRMDPVLEQLGQVAAGLAYAVPRVPWACGLTGELVGATRAGVLGGAGSSAGPVRRRGGGAGRPGRDGVPGDRPGRDAVGAGSGGAR